MAAYGTEKRNLAQMLCIDPWLMAMLVLLGGLGLATVYSATGGNINAAISQGQRMGVGLAALLIVARLPPNWFHGLALPGYLLCILLLVAVHLFGTEVNGSQRWLSLGGVRLQPSELMKIILPLALSTVLAPSRWPLGLGTLLLGLAMIAVPVALIGLQPDLGTALLVAAPGGFLMFLAGLRWKLLGVLIALSLAALPALWYTMHDYQRSRILTLFNPERDPQGAGYHIIQSKIAIGSGGLSGQGWMNGTQAQLDFLPEAHTDFIFAVFAEEHGFIGALALIAIYIAICARGLYIATQSAERFGRLLVSTLSVTVFVYVFVNMGMVSGILPVVGVPLPLMSYGGSSIVSLAVAFGLIMSVHSHNRPGLGTL